MRFTEKLFVVAVMFCLVVCGWISAQTSQKFGTHWVVRKHKKSGRLKRSRKGKRHLFRPGVSAQSQERTAADQTGGAEMKKAGEFKGDLRDLPRTKPTPRERPKPEDPPIKRTIRPTPTPEPTP